MLEAPPNSFDIVLSVSAIEHFSDDDLTTLASAIRRLLKPDGIVIITIDLFLNLKPFSEREKNEWGRNLDIRQFLEMAGLALLDGNPAELLGFPKFNPSRIMGNLATYLVGAGYPALSQCVVARRDHQETKRNVTVFSTSEEEPAFLGKASLDSVLGGGAIVFKVGISLSSSGADDNAVTF